MSYAVRLHEDAAEALHRLDPSIRKRLVKRIAAMREKPPRRHMRSGLDFFAEEVGQYRIVFTCEANQKVVYFVGNQKDYEKWYSKRKR
ncbi:hypothetical protein KJ765_01335 [Candidatus Micrarchaeota archaeon]|nr:hypothetical protein [Candidatus Micrarchaeota archaeon]